jgi:hypothetical protein
MSAPATAVTRDDDSRYYTDYRLPLKGEELLPVLQAVGLPPGRRPDMPIDGSILGLQCRAAPPGGIRIGTSVQVPGKSHIRAAVLVRFPCAAAA